MIVNEYTKSIDFAVLYSLFDKLTPLTIDCGTVCSGACCRNLVACAEERSSGMLLFPGEEAFREGVFPDCGGTVVPAGVDRLYLCGGACRREQRPLACRIFPLFPALGQNGRIRAVYDPRAWRVCPLVKGRRYIPLERNFVRTVRKAGRMVSRTHEDRAFLARQTAEIEEFNRFLRLDRDRPPICRKAVRGVPGTLEKCKF